jgi:hypothetical protein
MSAPRSFRRRKWFFLLASGALWALLAAASLAGGAVELARGERAALVARRTVSSALEAGRPGGADALRTAADHFDRAHLLLTNPVVAPLRWAPVLGRQVQVAGAAAGSGERLATAGADAVERLARLLDRPPEVGADRVRAAEDLVDLLTDARAAAGRVDLGPDEGLLPAVARRRRRFATKAAEATSTLDRGVRSASAVADLVRGPRRYLLLAANNAEMRAGSGMFLAAGTLMTRDGDLTLSPMRRTEDLVLPGDGVPYGDADLEARWGFTHPNREWRNLGLTPRFDATAPLAARMWEAATGEQVDGVLAIDVVALGRLVDATGPVDVDGTSYDGEAIVPYLLHDQYGAIVAGKGRSQAQAERREDLGAIASEVATAITAGSFSTDDLARALLDAVAGRHLLAWAADPAAQRGWVAAGVDGAVDGDELALALLNRGGNKLDPLVRLTSELSARPAPDGGIRFTAKVRVRNIASSAELPYVAGPGGGLPDPPGTYLGLLSLQLPGDVSGVSVEGAPSAVAGGDGPGRVIAADVVVPRGGELTVTFRFTRPADDGRMVIAPSARVPATTWTIGHRHRTDRLAQDVVWQAKRLKTGR